MFLIKLATLDYQNRIQCNCLPLEDLCLNSVPHFFEFIQVGTPSTFGHKSVKFYYRLQKVCHIYIYICIYIYIYYFICFMLYYIISLFLPHSLPSAQPWKPTSTNLEPAAPHLYVVEELLFLVRWFTVRQFVVRLIACITMFVALERSSHTL